jgi:hypothetical protein
MSGRQSLEAQLGGPPPPTVAELNDVALTTLAPGS